MDKQDIIRKMQEAGLKAPARGEFIFIHWDQIAMLLEHERDSEREACAKVCDSLSALIQLNGSGHALQIEAITDCADAIRERGQTK